MTSENIISVKSSQGKVNISNDSGKYTLGSMNVSNIDITVTHPYSAETASISKSGLGKRNDSTFTPRSPEPSMNGEGKKTSYFPLNENEDGTLDLFGDNELEEENLQYQENDYSSQYLHPTPPYTNYDDESPSSPSQASEGASKKHILESNTSTKLDSNEAPNKRQRYDGTDVEHEQPHSVNAINSVQPERKPSPIEMQLKSELSVVPPSSKVSNVAGGAAQVISDLPDSAVEEKEFLSSKEYPPMTKEQHKYIHAMLRQLRRGRDSIPFRAPVDSVKQNIPDYPSIVKHPMDLGTIQKKFSSGRYASAENFIDDMSLMFDNCFLYNGTESPVGVMGKNLQATFERQLKQLPSPYVTSSSRPGRRPRNTTTASRPTSRTRRQSALSSGRETMYDLKPHRRKDAAEMKFCQSVLKELLKKQHESYAYPFYKPVNPIACGCPDYYKVIKHPMDLCTMQNKLNHNEYASLKAFEADMLLMFKNCYKFNPPGTPVHIMGKKLESVFQKLWAEQPDFDSEAYPSLSSVNADYYYGDNDVFDSADEFLDDGEEFEAVNRQIYRLQSTLRAMKTRARSSSVSRSRSLSIDNFPPITYEMQNELAEQCNYLTADQLTHVAEILRSALPHLRKTDEIEIDVSSMPPDVFFKVYYYVCKGDETAADHILMSPQPQKERKGRALSEHEQAEKIRQLRAQLDRFAGIASQNKGLSDSTAAYQSKAFATDESSSEDDGESSESSDSA
ncbi:bromodomain protein [Schizosaccharomyces cryophilus OY26]|uniref:Bromodomain protein n=1 Tax=Schizosaccharomyces cryophilus (strain OY26 / ATCC MYA-4695 / CBS 11777 / NBRC 106824 / NRRL Y48691) TaxID=653667 RepID=S9X3N0_SCHCR|nr:bromodomain protein [Schizosaccharomyces cryophilus OY26]EPY51712.1 bromodomain protein [Schizosaccharomyces cryophilus OY26]